MIKRLYERGYDRSAIVNLLAFVDWLLILFNEAKVSFWQELCTYEEERQMPYTTSVEQIGYDRGIEEKAISIALNMLRKNLDVETIAEVTGLAIIQIQSLQV